MFAAILLAGAVFICFAPGQSEVLAYASSCIFIVGCSIATVGISR
ncbi:MAG: hypothetical protein Q4F54_00330 [Coriobacteriia bacterium]|nr:hypothetical protein [Coriobacteriia bacterium]